MRGDAFRTYKPETDITLQSEKRSPGRPPAGGVTLRREPEIKRAAFWRVSQVGRKAPDTNAPKHGAPARFRTGATYLHRERSSSRLSDLAPRT